ncbi:unnamed protein product [Clonostachys byssicola]|uniref:Uncharacterized protein n=1 Tax=Clonostachys byssicola TaxID=160290 RepID=A0A9N9UJQ6_9HYPO|nr:unnamed protein product [Clonostachys byssicola]
MFVIDKIVWGSPRSARQAKKRLHASSLKQDNVPEFDIYMPPVMTFGIDDIMGQSQPSTAIMDIFKCLAEPKKLLSHPEAVRTVLDQGFVRTPKIIQVPFGAIKDSPQGSPPQMLQALGNVLPATIMVPGDDQ